MPEWDPETVVDETLARALLADHFPELSIDRLRLLAEGWDNTVWLVNEQLVFRFPRRAIALPGVEREIDILPGLAPRLPVAVPVPTFIGRPTDAYRWPFFGAPLVPGDELADASLTDAARAGLAPALGRFLRELHDPANLDAFGERLPEDPNRRADMGLRVPMTRRPPRRARGARPVAAARLARLAGGGRGAPAGARHGPDPRRPAPAAHARGRERAADRGDRLGRHRTQRSGHRPAGLLVRAAAGRASCLRSRLRSGRPGRPAARSGAGGLPVRGAGAVRHN